MAGGVRRGPCSHPGVCVRPLSSPRGAHQPFLVPPPGPPGTASAQHRCLHVTCQGLVTYSGGSHVPTYPVHGHSHPHTTQFIHAHTQPPACPFLIHSPEPPQVK